ncbi:MAG: hypothetical protein JWN63_3626, partial [Candidatus Acidoferrum typicum]|nr:hypothetical protein [Candidatus Acidoferrum typicum]
MHVVAGCDHGGPLPHLFQSLVRKQNVNLGRRRSGRRLPSHEKAVPDLFVNTFSLSCSGGRKSPVIPGSMSDQH